MAVPSSNDEKTHRFSQQFRTYLQTPENQHANIRSRLNSFLLSDLSSVTEEMGKSDDSIARRKNRKSRKKQEDKGSSSKVSARVASIIAAKKRRMSGKRRNCQGMCFSLPTPEDPFNDRRVTIDLGKKKKKPVRSKADKMPISKSSVKLRKESLDNNDANNDHKKKELMKQDNAVDLGKEMAQMSNEDGPNHCQNKHGFENNIECPSKFLIMCLNSIQNALCNSGTINSEDKPLFANAWGIKFWNCYSNEKKLLETSGADSTIQQIAWIASTAADTIARKEKEGLSFTGPFLLFLVPSQEKASQVRLVCKPLKAIGIHTVSLHPGASIEHQINGLKSCEPEFLISTPQRLLELISLKAVDVSGVSLLVIDGPEAPCEGSSYLDTIKSIRYHISGDARTVVFSDCMNNSSISVIQKLLAGSSISTFMNRQSAGIMSTNTSKE